MSISEPAVADFDLRRERAKTISAIAIAFPAIGAIWAAIYFLTPPIAGMDAAPARLVFAVKCIGVVVLFCLVMGVEAVAHERLRSPAIDPLTGYETRRMRINLRYLQNTLEQTLIFVPALLGLAIYCPDGGAMRAVSATTVAWIVARIAFWVGYHRGSAERGYGAPGLMLTMLVLLYVCGRFGFEIAGAAGAGMVVVLFAAGEAFVTWATRPLRP